MKPTKKQVWNNIDAIGLMNGISTWNDNYLTLKYVRIPGESNIELRHKINSFLDTNNPLYGSIEQELIIGLANELGLDSYNIMEQKTFTLTRLPYPSGAVGVQDIFVYYQEPGLDTWTPILPQYWSQDVENNIPSSGFIVWEDSYYSSTRDLSKKTNNYSKLLQLYKTDIPDNSRLKIEYSVPFYDENDNMILKLFTDTSNPNNLKDKRYYYYNSYSYNESDLLTKPCVYTLDNIPDSLKYYYFDNNNRPTSLLYSLREKVDSVYRHRWNNIADRKTIWDIGTNFGSGCIPSFCDESVSNSEFKNYRTGGHNYHNTSLYIKDIDVIIDNDDEYWYPILQPGKFYYNGSNYYLMDNPVKHSIDLTSNSGVLPSGINICHKMIMYKTNNLTISGNIFDDVDYILDFDDVTDLTLNSRVARKRQYLTSAENGFQTILSSGEYMIDYNNNIIYSSGLTNCTIYYDNTLIPSGVVIQSPNLDLNPLNDTNFGFDKYFITIG